VWLDEHLNPNPAFSFQAKEQLWPVYKEPYKISGWLEATNKLAGGKYTWQISAKRGFMYHVLPDTDIQIADFSLAADFQLVKGPDDSEIGLVFGWVDPENFDYFGINQKGEFFLYRNSKGQWKTLLYPEASDLFNPKKINHLSAWRQGSKLYLYLNHSLLTIYMGTSPAKGKFGLGFGLHQSGDAADWQVTNFEVSAP
jgi:hypothetical protein